MVACSPAITKRIVTGSITAGISLAGITMIVVASLGFAGTLPGLGALGSSFLLGGGILFILSGGVFLSSTLSCSSCHNQRNSLNNRVQNNSDEAKTIGLIAAVVALIFLL